MKLERPVCFLDIEATGLDPAVDRIVEIAVVKVHPGGHTTEHERRLNPEIPIPAEATAIHGITDADVADKPTFARVAQSLHALLADCDLGGYNLLNYDVPLLWEEFYRAGIEWNLEGVRIIDVGNVFKKKEPRDLSAAVRFYSTRLDLLVDCYNHMDSFLHDLLVKHPEFHDEFQEFIHACPDCGRNPKFFLEGKDHAGAHGALADALATYEVFASQQERYQDIWEMTLDQLAEFSRLDDLPRIDLAGTLVRDAEGFAVYTHKRVRGVRMVDDPGYGYWMTNQRFSANTLMHVRLELDRAYKWRDQEAAQVAP